MEHAPHLTPGLEASETYPKHSGRRARTVSRCVCLFIFVDKHRVFVGKHHVDVSRAVLRSTHCGAG